MNQDMRIILAAFFLTVLCVSVLGSVTSQGRFDDRAKQTALTVERHEKGAAPYQEGE